MAAQCATDSDDNPLWQYALTVYAKPGIAQHLLLGQDQLGLDVLWCLTALWLAEQKQRLTPALMQQVAYDEWRSNMIIPLRELRYRCDKTRDAALRKALLAAELAAEKRGIALLYAGVEGNNDIVPVEDCDLEELVQRNLSVLTDRGQWIHALAQLCWQSNG
ncbi:TIGR02444 family protein [Thalassolituus oleivorans]|uniref:TIGR02444 family protein n=1 Tax=Thalassolituus oleivorans TaxID=187493 RepID=UPI0009492B9F|nr:TIGR02444 family protein [Thalassolituus oleivorans]APR65488.1 TIGR02444 family protein [Thalassolituus oleivorans]